MTTPNIVFILMDNLGYGEPGCYGGGIIAAIGAERAEHHQWQGLEILRTEKSDDAEIAERKTEGEGEHQADIPAEQRIFHPPELLPAGKAERSDELSTRPHHGIERRP